MTQAFAPVRRILAVDAFTCLAAGALMAFAPAPLGDITDLPPGLLFAAGASLFPIAALFAWMSRTPRLTPALIWFAVIGNMGWVAASLGVLALTQPSPFGYAFVLAQAGAVAGLAMLEAGGVSDSQTPRPA